MRTIVHLSDLHFGRVDPRIVGPLTRAVNETAPDLIAVSGDFTQRARPRQFAEARAFLDTLRYRQLLVPGNHDVPLYNVGARFLAPFTLYRRHIADTLEPSFADDEIAVIGLNTARSFVTKGGGRLDSAQIARAVEHLRALPPHLIKIIVTHHPFDVPEGVSADHLVGRAAMAMGHLGAVGADLFLAGHIHVSHVGHTAERYRIRGHSALVVQAGTMSTRGRGELNTFNVLRVERPRVTIERHSWEPGHDRFVTSWRGRFQHTAGGWSEMGSGL
jgi:3',5'-cyclic AMP phosphodiesterase CpdA